MTRAEINSEFEYRIAERIGILVDSNREPTKWEYQIARAEAFEAIEKIKNETI